MSETKGKGLYELLMQLALQTAEHEGANFWLMTGLLLAKLAPLPESEPGGIVGVLADRCVAACNSEDELDGRRAVLEMADYCSQFVPEKRGR